MALAALAMVPELVLPVEGQGRSAIVAVMIALVRKLMVPAQSANWRLAIARGQLAEPAGWAAHFGSANLAPLVAEGLSDIEKSCSKELAPVEERSVEPVQLVGLQLTARHCLVLVGANRQVVVPMVPLKAPPLA
jgi:hypothetical protein